MWFFELLGISVFLYYLITIVLWTVLDSDIELFFYQKFGKPISSLRGKVIWITGAASGLGKHLALTLAKNGVRLCLSDIQMDELEKVKNECLKLSPSLTTDDILLLNMNVLEFDKHGDHFQNVLNYFDGHVDVLVNNAGRAQRGTWANIDIDVDRDMMELDVFSHVNLTRIYVRHLQKFNRKGHVFVTASMVGIMPFPFSASYSGAKYAVVGYFTSLKAEYPDLDVTIFCPGPIFSNFMRDAFTNVKGERLNQQQSSTDNRMATERCAFHMATAIANKLHLNFCANFPLISVIYLSCYYPNLKNLIFRILGKDALIKLRDTNVKKIK